MGRLSWDGLDERGRRVRPGLYFVRCDRMGGLPIPAPSFAKVVRLE
jgi:hypothetical protein